MIKYGAKIDDISKTAEGRKDAEKIAEAEKRRREQSETPTRINLPAVKNVP